jgi:hypothetical protein
VSIVLHRVVRRLHELLARPGDAARVDLCRHLRIDKVCNDVSEPVPAEVEVLQAKGNDEQSASAQWSVDYIVDLRRIGKRLGQEVKLERFRSFV